ncbi:hypothetical protein KY326_03145 [Candidatus Woesearchaeota archaeon]|nr:hypothetical protein [Candidatus Woesearchaeota archaeon]
MLYSINKYLRFEKKEVFDIIVTVVRLCFIFSFKTWGTAYFDVGIGLTNWFGMSLVAVLALLVHIVVQKLFAIKKGYTIRYKMWLIGLLVGVYFCFISNGSWIFFLPGGIIFSIIAHKRLRYKQPSIQQKDVAYVSFFGPFANILLALIFHIIVSSGVSNTLLEKAIPMNIFFAIYTLLPIPQLEAMFSKLKMKEAANLDGFAIIYFSRPLYVFALALIILLALSLQEFGSLISIVLSFVIAVIIALAYFLKSL